MLNSCVFFIFLRYSKSYIKKNISTNGGVSSLFNIRSVLSLPLFFIVINLVLISHSYANYGNIAWASIIQTKHNKYLLSKNMLFELYLMKKKKLMQDLF